MSGIVQTLLKRSIAPRAVGPVPPIWEDWTPVQRVARAAQMTNWRTARQGDPGIVIECAPDDLAASKLEDGSSNNFVLSDWNVEQATLEATPPEDTGVLHVGDTGIWRSQKTLWNAKATPPPFNDGGTATYDYICRYIYLLRTVISTQEINAFFMGADNAKTQLFDEFGATRRLRPKYENLGDFNIKSAISFAWPSTPANGTWAYVEQHRRWTGSRGEIRTFAALNGGDLVNLGLHQFHGSTPTTGTDADGFWARFANQNVDATSGTTQFRMGGSNTDGKFVWAEVQRHSLTSGRLASAQAAYDALRFATD